MSKFVVDRCGSPINCNLKYELRDSKYEVIVRHTAVMTAATHAWLCNTAPQAPDSELRTSYIVIRTFKLRFSVHVSNDAHAFTVCRCGSPINFNLSGRWRLPRRSPQQSCFVSYKKSQIFKIRLMCSRKKLPGAGV